MKRALCIWLEDEAQKGLSVSDAVATEEAEQLNIHYEESCSMQKGSFHASIGWFANW
jgi:Tc5 transposase DNA-binding domain.